METPQNKFIDNVYELANEIGNLKKLSQYFTRFFGLFARICSMTFKNWSSAKIYSRKLVFTLEIVEKCNFTFYQTQ